MLSSLSVEIDFYPSCQSGQHSWLLTKIQLLSVNVAVGNSNVTGVPNLALGTGQ